MVVVGGVCGGMALVLMCGQPCSGKSAAASCFAKALGMSSASSSSPPPLLLIDEPSLNLQRNQCYGSMPSEKNLRSLLRSEVDRSVSKENIVIVDSLNNIKGYRYELWCLARAAGIKYLVLYCQVGEHICRAWNKARREEGKPSYEEKVFDDLVSRFEEPNKRNRWDSPLFELRPAEEIVSESSPTIVEAVSYLHSRSDLGRRNAQLLQPTIATQNVRTTEANSLYALDQATQEVISVLVEAQAQNTGGSMRSVSVGEGLPFINLHRSVFLPELRRLRRTFTKLAGQSSLSGPPPPSDAHSVKRMFVEYLNRELSAS